VEFLVRDFATAGKVHGLWVTENVRMLNIGHFQV